MTITEITPEMLRDVADWIDGTGHGLGPGAALRDEADRIEREQSDEKRIDELAKVYADAFAELSGDAEWCCAPDYWRNAHRAGVRAVRAHLDGDVIDAEVYGVRDNGDVLLSASDAASVKAVLRFVFGRHNGERYPTSDIETLKTYFWPADMSCTYPVGAKPDDKPKFDKGGDAFGQPLRQWSDLRDVPEDVAQVTGSDPSLIAYRDESAEHGWMWKLRGYYDAPASESGLTHSAPFTEVIADA